MIPVDERHYEICKTTFRHRSGVEQSGCGHWFLRLQVLDAQISVVGDFTSFNDGNGQAGNPQCLHRAFQESLHLRARKWKIMRSRVAVQRSTVPRTRRAQISAMLAAITQYMRKLPVTAEFAQLCTA